MTRISGGNDASDMLTVAAGERSVSCGVMRADTPRKNSVGVVCRMPAMQFFGRADITGLHASMVLERKQEREERKQEREERKQEREAMVQERMAMTQERTAMAQERKDEREHRLQLLLALAGTLRVDPAVSEAVARWWVTGGPECLEVQGRPLPAELVPLDAPLRLLGAQLVCRQAVPGARSCAQSARSP